MISEIDVRAALPAIRVPTLVIQRLGDRINPPFYGRYIAAHIPGARYFEQPGDHVLRFAESEELVGLFAEIEDFLATTPTSTEPSRVLTTILLAERVRDVATSRTRALPPRPSTHKHRGQHPRDLRRARPSDPLRSRNPCRCRGSRHPVRESGSTPAKSAS